MKTAVVVMATLACLGAVERAGAAPVELRSGTRTFRMDPATLRLESVSSVGNALRLSDGQSGLGLPAALQTNDQSATWQLPHAGLAVVFAVAGDGCTVRITANGPGNVTWPIVRPDHFVRALILPRGEGLWIPPDDQAWGQILSGDNTLTEEFFLPCWGLDLGPQTVTYLVPEPFDCQITYARRQGRLGFSVMRRFTRLDAQRTWEVHLEFGAGSPIEPARKYREWLKAQGRFVSMADKIAATPSAERLLGALQAYLWGLPLEPADVKNWTSFMRRLAELPDSPTDSAAGRLWAALPAAGRKAVHGLLTSQWQDDYEKSEVTRAFADLLAKGVVMPDQIAEVFPTQLTPPSDWGDGISIPMLSTLAESGIDRACLILNDLSSGARRPDVARFASQQGYLYGPYDSYDGVHDPHQVDTWETSQFDADLFVHGAVIDEKGKPRSGFQNVGHVLNAAAAKPYMERRIGGMMAKVPYSAWFVDCDASGQFFDDFSPDHPATMGQDCAARIDRLQWITKTFGLPVGSENGSATTAGATFFGHGMLTGAIGGWEDPELEKEHSKWWLGGYWPPEAPHVFFMPVPLKARFRLEFCDPRYRLPLYEAALHDSVIATHHWSAGSLKFKDDVVATALLEQLYNVPPLYHLTRREFARIKDGLLAHYRFFSPLHRRLGLQPLTGFSWLTPDRLVQRTTFGDGTTLTANFSGRPWTGSGLSVPARTIVSQSAGELTTYTPQYPKVGHIDRD